MVANENKITMIRLIQCEVGVLSHCFRWKRVSLAVLVSNLIWQERYRSTRAGPTSLRITLHLPTVHRVVRFSQVSEIHQNDFKNFISTSDVEDSSSCNLSTIGDTGYRSCHGCSNTSHSARRYQSSPGSTEQ